jgi:Tfp pilus assembly protein PilZ
VASPEELAEFQALSLKVSDRTATAAELARWRELRTLLAKPIPTPMPSQIPRQHARAARKLKVGFAPLSALHATFTEEISPGGIKIRVPGLIETGVSVVLRLELGEPGPLTVTARVAWCRRDGGHYLAGLEFVGLRDDERDRIEAWSQVSGPNPPTTTGT